MTSWAAAGTKPLSDAQAAACVTHQSELRPDNVQANDYIPTSAELQAWRTAQANQEHTPQVQYVDGLDGLSNPSTDDLIEWTAHKWGIPEDWIRAQMVVQSHWHQSDLGNLTTVPSSDYQLYPAYSRASGSSCSSNCQVYQSLGVMQIRWTPSATDTAVGTEPLRWESTAFNLDFYGAVVRWFYDGDCGWCGSGYGPGQAWASIGAWDSPYPWNNSGAQSYVSQVQSALAAKAWSRTGF